MVEVREVEVEVEVEVDKDGLTVKDVAVARRDRKIIFIKSRMSRKKGDVINGDKYFA